MKPLNYKQVRSKMIKFWMWFLMLVIFLFLPIFFLCYSCGVQKDFVSKDLEKYKQILNRQTELHQKVDSLYQLMQLLNTGKVGNDLFLEQYISNSKDEIIKIIKVDSSAAFKHYSLLLSQVDKMLLLKDTIRVISDKENLSYRDLMECINKNRKIKNDLSFDPTRNFSTNK